MSIPTAAEALSSSALSEAACARQIVCPLPGAVCFHKSLSGLHPPDFKILLRPQLVSSREGARELSFCSEVTFCCVGDSQPWSGFFSFSFETLVVKQVWIKSKQNLSAWEELYKPVEKNNA